MHDVYNVCRYTAALAQRLKTANIGATVDNLDDVQYMN